MKNLETLIQELCPDGVEFVKLGVVCEIKRGIRVVKKDLQETGKIPVYQNSLVPLGYKDEFNYPSNVAFVISAGAAGDVGYSEVPFWAADDCLTITCPSNIENKYVYYFLKNYEYKLKSKVRKASIPRLSRKVVDDLEIPLPPIEVQTEIVRILDKFTSLEVELEAELEAELDCRKRQYEYYRDKLLSFDNVGGQEVEWKKMSEVCEIYDGTHQTPKYQTEGIPFISVENIKDIYGSNKYISIEAYEAYKVKPKVGDVFMTRIGSIGACAVFTKQEDVAYYVSLALLRPNSAILDSRFLKHLIESSIGKRELSKRTLHNAVPIKINKSDIGKVKLPIPSLEEQHRIVSILDRFESLTTSLQSGLPAEISARCQQYEHYRDKLLTFKRKGAA